jgi:hypothetical protein
VRSGCESDSPGKARVCSDVDVARPSRRRQLLSVGVIVASWFVYRAYVYGVLWTDVNVPHDLGPWYYPVPLLRERFVASLLYLRIMPPLPQFVIGLLIKLFGWPFGLPLFSFVLSLFTLGSALLIRKIILASGFGLLAATAVPFVFVVSPDPLGFEMDGARSLHEGITSFLLILSVFTWFTKTRRWSLPLVVSLLVMSRATLSYFAPAGLLVSLAFRSRRLFWVFLPALLVQLLWMGKNLAVFGEADFETCSVSGRNLANVVSRPGNYEAFRAMSAEQDLATSEIVQCYFRGALFAGGGAECLPKEWAKDQVFARRLGCESVGLPAECYFSNSYVYRAWSGAMKRAYVRFMMERPAVLVGQAMRGYRLFWSDAREGFELLRAAAYEDRLWVWSWLSTGTRLLNVLLLHTLGVLVFLVLCARVLVGRDVDDVEKAFLYGCGAFVYVAMMSSAVDFGENARFRFAVEPVIWVIPFLAFRCARVRRGAGLRERKLTARVGWGRREVA